MTFYAGLDLCEYLKTRAALAVKDDVRQFIANGSDLGTVDSSGHSALHIAAHLGLEGITNLILKSGSPIDLRDHTSQTELMRTSNPSIVFILLSKGADPLAVDDMGSSAMTIFAKFGKDECLKKLLAANTTMVNETNNGGRTPLMEAAYGGHDICMKMLLEAGADASLKDNDGRDIEHLMDNGFFNREAERIAITALFDRKTVQFNRKAAVKSAITDTVALPLLRPKLVFRKKTP